MDDRRRLEGERKARSLVEAGEQRPDASEDPACGEAKMLRALFPQAR
jgi:hypothetical protein